MIIDDRLETVLRTNVAGKAGARTQLRQLVDLLGAVPLAGWAPQHARALERADTLAAMLSDEECAAVLRSASHRSAVLVYHFAHCGPRTASAIIASARLEEQDWLALIPRLPTTARGFLRHRTGLGDNVRALLSRLGIDDFLLPRPVTAKPVAATQDAIAPATPKAPEESRPATEPAIVPDDTKTTDPARRAEEGIGAIVRRIEDFRRKREARLADDAGSARAEMATGTASGPSGIAPLLPFVDQRQPSPALPAFIDIRTDAQGVVTQASIDPAGMVIGSRPFAVDPGNPLRCARPMADAFRQRQPVVAGRVVIEAAQGISGIWHVDGTPCFTSDGGRFAGYLLRLRRGLAVAPTARQEDARDAVEPANEADRLRQLLHELRTPINAIQGFAEVIQQQVFGATPHQYRAMAASIAADAAHMLAGFEEVERLVRLESQSLEIDRTKADVSAIVAQLVEQVSPTLAARNVRLTLSVPSTALSVAFAADELERSVWRVFSVIAASVAPGERLAIELAAMSDGARITIALPASLHRLDDEALFAPDAAGSGGALSASAMLGNGFALRLARAEFASGGGSLVRDGSRLLITLPGADADTATAAVPQSASNAGERR